MKLSSLMSNYKQCDYLIKFRQDDGPKYGMINYIFISKNNIIKLKVNDLRLVEPEIVSEIWSSSNNSKRLNVLLSFNSKM
jgi:hypothetical protein